MGDNIKHIAGDYQLRLGRIADLGGRPAPTRGPAVTLTDSCDPFEGPTANDQKRKAGTPEWLPVPASLTSTCPGSVEIFFQSERQKSLENADPSVALRGAFSRSLGMTAGRVDGPGLRRG